MELTLDNLDDIHRLLTSSYNKAMAALKNVDFEADIVPSPEKRQWLNTMLDQMGETLMEVSHVHSFLQQCNLSTESLTPHQQQSIKTCQELCEQLKDAAKQFITWIIHLKEHFNETACPMIDDDWDQTFQSTTSDCRDIEVVPEAYLHQYQQVRDILKDIHKEVMILDPENMINTAGRRLNVLKGKQMFIETEHEMNLLVDYGLFQYRKEGKNVVERYYDSHHPLYPPQKLTILRAFKEARFSLLEIVRPVEEHGIIVHDHLRGESFLMIDRGLYRLAKSQPQYALLTHYLQMPGFILTTGASVPVSLNSLEEKAMRHIFERLINHHHQKHLLERSSYLQCITDLFKIAIHENVAKTVTSRALPMNYQL